MHPDLVTLCDHTDGSWNVITTTAASGNYDWSFNLPHDFIYAGPTPTDAAWCSANAPAVLGANVNQTTASVAIPAPVVNKTLPAVGSGLDIIIALVLAVAATSLIEGLKRGILLRNR